jgi:hypothetical protein
MNVKKTYVVIAPHFMHRVGGILVLYYLCHLLRTLGESAFIGHNIKDTRRKGIKVWKRRLQGIPFDVESHDEKITDEIVIYPETMMGNAKNAKNVVRYLLHKPGFHTNGRIEYGDNELVIGWGQEVSGSGYEITDENNIKIIYNMDDVYYQTNFGERTKTCYMIRKAKKTPTKEINFHPADSICLDKKSHTEVARILNECDRFICYDPYTYYSTFATKCGCTSIVIPDEGVSKEDWKPNVKDTYGIAYGLDDIEYAIETKDKFLEYQKEIEQNNIDAVKKFVKLCEEYFVD